MPELPELEVVREVLQRRVVGQRLTEVQVIPPGGAIVTRDLTHKGFEQALTGARIRTIARRGKFLVFALEAEVRPLFLAINPKLTGRLQLTDPSEKKMPRTYVLFSLEGGQQLRYFDQKQMGQLYLTRDLD